MTGSLWKCLAGAVALGAAAMGACGPALAQPPVWVVSDADSEMLLFGSVHVLPPGLNWRPAALNAAIAKAEDVWFELPVDGGADAEAARLAAALGYLPADQTLTGLLSQDSQARLNRMAEQYGLPLSLLDRFEPWLAEVALAGAMYRMSGADAASGVEKTLAAAVPPTAARRAFETPAQQVGLFDATPMDEQIASFEVSLREAEEDPQVYAELVSAWMRGDVAALEADALGPLREASPGIYERLVTARNAAWIDTLDERLKGRGRTVVIVGVGHLLGEDGLPARLRALGYSVKGPYAARTTPTHGNPGDDDGRQLRDPDHRDRAERR